MSRRNDIILLLEGKMGVGEVASICSEIHHGRALSLKIFQYSCIAPLTYLYCLLCRNSGGAVVGVLKRFNAWVHIPSLFPGHYRGVKNRLCTPGPEWLQSQAIPDVHCQLRWSGWEGPGECLGNIDINLMYSTYHNYVTWWGVMVIAAQATHLHCLSFSQFVTRSMVGSHDHIARWIQFPGLGNRSYLEPVRDLPLS